MSFRWLGVLVAAWSSVALADGGQQRCLDVAQGATPVFLRWVGAVDGTSRSVLSLTGNPAKVTLNLKSGYQRTTTEERTVSIQRLRRSVSGDGLRVDSVDARDSLELPLYLDFADGGRLIDSYVLEFTPTHRPNAKESCLLSYADLWRWAGNVLKGQSPLEQAGLNNDPAAFKPGTLPTAPLTARLAAGQTSAAEQLWLEPLKSVLGPPRFGQRDPSWQKVSWDGGSSTISVSLKDKAYGYNVWLCATTPEGGPDTCVVAAQYKLNDQQKLAIRAESEVALTQELSLQQLIEAGTITSYGLVMNPANNAKVTYSYDGEQRGTVPAALSQFVSSEKHVEYTFALLGSADYEHLGGHCPEKPPAATDKIVSFATGPAFDAVGCFYRREVGQDWLRVTDDSAERPVLDSIRFQLCSNGKCVNPSGASGQAKVGFKLGSRGATANLRIVKAEGKPALTLDSWKDLPAQWIVTPPMLPAAPAAEGIMASLRLDSFTSSEWDTKHAAACIESDVDWAQLGINDNSDGAATLMLWAGDARQPVGSGHWKIETVDTKQLLCPTLTKDDVSDMLRRIREALMAGQSAALYTVQGGRFVGHTLMITGPARPAVSAFQLMSGSDQPVKLFSRYEPVPSGSKLCVTTNGDWGEKIFLDPTAIALADDAGQLLATFQTFGKQLHPFARMAGPDKTGQANAWRYCSGVSEKGAVGDVLGVSHPAAPGPGVTTAAWTLTGANCGGGLCGSIPAEPISTTVGAHATSLFHTGLGWGHVFSFSSFVPATEVRAFAAIPVALADWTAFHGALTVTGEAGGMFGLAWGRGVSDGTFATRIAVPLSGYGGLCLNGTGLRSKLGASPQLCFNAAVDVLSFKTTATAANPAAKFGVEGFNFVPFVSLGVGEF